MILSGRTILITGGSAGIGLAFALKFVELGNTVIVTGRRESVLDEVKKRDPKLHTIQSDVADPGQIKQGLKDGDILVLAPPANLSDGLRVFVAH